MSSRALRRGVAYQLRDETGSARISFTWDGIEYSVSVDAVRHLRANCPLIERLRASNVVAVDRVQNDAELGAKTARCTGGCWDAWERAEQNGIASGDERRRIDWEEDGVGGRVRLARWIREGLVPGEVVTSVDPNQK
ncbi:MAG: hypothetical protein M3364_09900 [Actinomycetota bacterium]|nr:hypothetical protein [Actinomycetota bacterium]